MTYFEEVSVDDARTLIEQPGVLILDNRDAYSYKDSHINGAMQAHDGLVEHLLKSKQFDKTLFIYCYHGNSSKDLAELLGSRGYKNCYSLKGGYTAWKKANEPTEQPSYSDSVTSWLVENGFSEVAVNEKNSKSVTPILLACQTGELAIVKELISAGADLTLRDNYGNSSLWAACYSNKAELVRLVEENGIDIDTRNTDGVTALMLAASSGRDTIVETLLSLNADKSLTTIDGFTALDLASNTKILKLLKQEAAALA